MGKRARQVIVRIAIGIVVGLILGAAIGWWLWPVTYTNTSPASLRQDYRDDYILMVARTYELEEDIEHARSRLEQLDAETPSEPIVELAERLMEQDSSEAAIARLARLARDLGADAPSLTPYLED
jgi:hypothetical protein